MAGEGPPRGHVLFSGDDRLEGILEWPDTHPAGGIVVAHPHPLYGGTMAQPVVYRVAQSCRQRGFATLRFNFRGVGQSAGRYSGVEEPRDIEAALAYLRGRLAASSGEEREYDSTGGRPVPLGLAGYSFGSVMAARAAGEGLVGVQALVLIALVLDWEEWGPGVIDGLRGFAGPVLAVCAESDELAPPAAVERALSGLGVDFRLTVVKGTGHLFEQRQREVGELVGGFFDETLGKHLPASAARSE